MVPAVPAPRMTIFFIFRRVSGSEGFKIAECHERTPEVSFVAHVIYPNINFSASRDLLKYGQNRSMQPHFFQFVRNDMPEFSGLRERREQHCCEERWKVLLRM
jgi:hypothetical protein